MTTAKQELRIAANRALELFDAGKIEDAICSFLNDTTKDVRTAWIATNPRTMPALRDAITDRAKFEETMVGFNVIG